MDAAVLRRACRRSAGTSPVMPTGPPQWWLKRTSRSCGKVRRKVSVSRSSTLRERSCSGRRSRRRGRRSRRCRPTGSARRRCAGSSGRSCACPRCPAGASQPTLSHCASVSGSVSAMYVYSGAMRRRNHGSCDGPGARREHDLVGPHLATRGREPHGRPRGVEPGHRACSRGARAHALDGARPGRGRAVPDAAPRSGLRAGPPR